MQIGTSKTGNKDISKTITACSLRFGKLKEDGEDGLLGEKGDRQVNGWGKVFHTHNF